MKGLHLTLADATVEVHRSFYPGLSLRCYSLLCQCQHPAPHCRNCVFIARSEPKEDNSMLACAVSIGIVSPVEKKGYKMQHVQGRSIN